MLTDYVGWAKWHVHTGEREEETTQSLMDLNAGFQGVQPWDRNRSCCVGGLVEMKKTEIWIA